MTGIGYSQLNAHPFRRYASVQRRSDEERERDGTAALTAGAIGRGAAVPLPYIGGSLSRNVRNADELAYQIAATVAFGLVQVRDGRLCCAESYLRDLAVKVTAICLRT